MDNGAGFAVVLAGSEELARARESIAPHMENEPGKALLSFFVKERRWADMMMLHL